MMSALQSDFGCLAMPQGEAAATECESALMLSDAHCPLKSSKMQNVSNDDYVPVNYICDEALAIISAWEAAYQANAGCIATDISNAIYEPSRTTGFIVDSSKPPKRFYRTFWRSVTRRLVQLSKK